MQEKHKATYAVAGAGNVVVDIAAVAAAPGIG